MYKDDEKYHAKAITPSNTTDLSGYEFRGFFVGVGGDVAIEPVGNDTPIVFKNVASGSFMPVAFDKINATDTTATSIVGLL